MTMTAQLPLLQRGSQPSSKTTPAGCGSCALLSRCGGLTDPNGQHLLWGCFTGCVTPPKTASASDRNRTLPLPGECRGPDSCDFTCPMRPDFVRRMREIGGFDPPTAALRAMSVPELPEYVPLIKHRSSRILPVDEDVVAVSLFDVVRMTNGRYGAVVTDGPSLRSRFGLKSSARVLLVGVSEDKPIERYWRYARRDRTAATFSGLDLLGITVPNYSFFLDAPRSHLLWNWGRMTRVAEDLSAAGVEIVPHLNGLVEETVSLWTKFLVRHDGIRYVAKEFQTGLRSRERGERAIAHLAHIQDAIGRELHPIAVGGAQYADTLARFFARSTIIDATPFIKTVKRQRRTRGGRSSWEAAPTAADEPIDVLLEENIQRHRAHILRKAQAARPRRGVAA